MSSFQGFRDYMVFSHAPPKPLQIYTFLPQGGVGTGVNKAKIGLIKLLRVLTYDSPKSPLNRLITVMGIYIQCHADIGMPHQILQTFYIDPSLLHIGTECVPENVRRNRGHVVAVNLPILPLHTTHVVLYVHCHFRLFIWISIRLNHKTVHTSMPITQTGSGKQIPESVVLLCKREFAIFF